MECMSCGAEIPSEWKAAIKMNTCPKCGGQIMSDEMLNLTSQLQNTIDLLIEQGPEVMDKVLDTFGLMRKPVPGQAPVKSTKPSDNDGLPADFKTPQNKVQEFLRRSKAPHLANRENKIAALKNSIENAKNSGSDPDFNEYTDEYGTEGMGVIKAKDFLENKDSNVDLDQVSQLFSDDVDVDYDPSLPKALQLDRIKRLEKSRQVGSGMSEGSFRRSGD